jgi:hypothetical protein
VTTKLCPVRAPDVQLSVNTGNPEMFNAGELLVPALAMPILRGALTNDYRRLGCRDKCQKPEYSGLNVIETPNAVILIAWC